MAAADLCVWLLIAMLNKKTNKSHLKREGFLFEVQSVQHGGLSSDHGVTGHRQLQSESRAGRAQLLSPFVRSLRP